MIFALFGFRIFPPRRKYTLGGDARIYCAKECCFFVTAILSVSTHSVGLSFWQVGGHFSLVTLVSDPTRSALELLEPAGVSNVRSAEILCGIPRSR